MRGGRAGRGPLAVPSDPWPGDAAKGRAILTGIFHFAGLRLDDPEPLWQAPGADEAWLVELHGFSWLRDLRALGGDSARQCARDLTADWLASGAVRLALARRPEVTGERITHLLTLYDFFIASADPVLRQKICSSLSHQAELLSRSLPAGLAGRPLVLALRGLITAGCCLPRGDHWLARGLTMLERALAAQVLGDGGHIERSPLKSYQVLRDLVEIRSLLVLRGKEVPDLLVAAIAAMAPCLRLFVHGDGELAYFNGTVAGQALALEMLLQRCDGPKRPLMQARESGFQRLQAGRALIIADAGAPPPQGVDGEAHGGLLSFEFSHGRQRLIVNCGAFSADPNWSPALRATAAPQHALS